MEPDADLRRRCADRHASAATTTRDGNRAAGAEESATSLLEAIGAISSELDTFSVLSRLVVSACELTGSAGGALGVITADGTLSGFVTHGLDPQPFEEADALPTDRGVHTSIQVRGTAFGELYLSERTDGRPFDKKDALLVQGLANVAGILIENAHAYSLSERRRRWLEMFGDLTELLLPPITLSAAFERIAESVRTASGAETSAVLQITPDDEIVIAAVTGTFHDVSETERAEWGAAVRSVARTGEVVDVRIRDRVAVLAALRAHLTMPGVIVTIHERRGAAEHFEERELLASFANHAALALDRTQALEDREQMAVVSDRDRIARDLHDVVIQRLFATGLHMQSIRSAATTPQLRERIDQSVKDLDQTIRDIRGTIFELETRPQNSLRTEVRDLVREYVPVLGFAPSVQTHGPVDSSVETSLQQQLVAVLREALSNVARHSGATTASVDLQVTPTHLRLKVSDDGKGVPEVRDESGLRNARRRAILLGGTLDLWPNEPNGTSFIWSVPFKPGVGAASQP